MSDRHTAHDGSVTVRSSREKTRKDLVGKGTSGETTVWTVYNIAIFVCNFVSDVGGFQ